MRMQPLVSIPVAAILARTGSWDLVLGCVALINVVAAANYYLHSTVNVVEREAAAAEAKAKKEALKAAAADKQNALKEKLANKGKKGKGGGKKAWAPKAPKEKKSPKAKGKKTPTA